MQVVAVQLDIFHFMGIAPKAPEQQSLRLGRRTVLVGPNNAGKSTVVRLLQLIATLITECGLSPEIRLPRDKLDQGYWWNRDVKVPLHASLTLEYDKEYATELNYAPGAAALDGRAIVDFTAVFLRDYAYVRFEYRQIAARAFQEPALPPVWTPNCGGYESSSTSLGANWRQPAEGGARNIERLAQDWARSTRFFAPVRSLTADARPNSWYLPNDFLQKFHQLHLDASRADEFASLRRQVIGNINAVLEPSRIAKIRELRISGQATNRPVLFLTFESQNASEVRLDNVGSGLAELIIVVSTLSTDADLPYLNYFIEEPESHLHPGLFCRFLDFLTSNQKLNLVITSHSPVALDMVGEESRIYHVAQIPDAGSVFKECPGISARHSILDALGVAPASLLQTNCVVWVEGPSDRLYLREWIRLWCRDNDERLVEGSDYSFVFYGGKVLARVSFWDESVLGDDLISAIAICRSCIFVMDRDIAPTAPTTELRETKQRIIREAEVDPKHRLAVVTTGIEIENDVDDGVFASGIKAFVSTKEWRGHIGTPVFLPAVKYTRAVLDSLTGPADRPEREKTEDQISNCLALKFELARRVVDASTSYQSKVSQPVYVDQIARFILQCRLPQA